MRNDDDECFKWSILSAVNHEEVDSKHTDRMNPEYAINVFALYGKEIYYARVSDFAETPSRTTINLLLIEQEGRKHFTWIKNICRLYLKKIG